MAESFGAGKAGTTWVSLVVARLVHSPLVLYSHYADHESALFSSENLGHGANSVQYQCSDRVEGSRTRRSVVTFLFLFLLFFILHSLNSFSYLFFTIFPLCLLFCSLKPKIRTSRIYVLSLFRSEKLISYPLHLSSHCFLSFVFPYAENQDAIGVDALLWSMCYAWFPIDARDRLCLTSKLSYRVLVSRSFVRFRECVSTVRVLPQPFVCARTLTSP